MNTRGISILSVLVVVIVVCAGGFFYLAPKKSDNPSRTLLASHPELYTYYDEAIAAQKDIASNGSIAQPYLHVGLEWATIGSITKDPVWYQAALRVYQQADAALQGKNSVILLNLADTQTQLGQYNDAKNTLERTIALTPGDATVYSTLIDLLRYKSKASPDEILAVYAEGIKRVLGAGELFIERAAYLRDIGRFADARADYEAAHKGGALSDQAYASALKELSAAQK